MFDSREYSTGEIVADAIVHIVALVASIAAASAVIVMAVIKLELPVIVALSVYAATLIAMFGFSLAYNIIPHKPVKPLLRRFDQAGIFLKIAGTYTPLTILIGSLFSHALLAVIWLVALAGVALKTFGRMHRDRYTIPLYLALGWASLLLVFPVAKTLPAIDVVLFITGGLVYTAGVIFHVWDDLKYQNAIWHGFVFIAATCHFTALSHSAFALAG